MIKKILILSLCAMLLSCSGFAGGAGLKIKNGYIKIEDHMSVYFEDPIGKCGSEVTFFGILIPIIPVWYKSNSCEESFDINADFADYKGVYGEDLTDFKITLRYDGIIHDPYYVEDIELSRKKNERYNEGYEYRFLKRKFRFKIHNFLTFKRSLDKAIIVSIEMNGRRKFSREVPVKWGIVRYNKWYFPS